MIAAEGRKAGVHLALALQDPTHKSIDLRIRQPDIVYHDVQGTAWTTIFQ